MAMRSLEVVLALVVVLAAPAVQAAAVAVDSNVPQMETETDPKYKLPDGFLFGAGTGSYQTEGAWDQDDKTPNVLDYGYHLANETINGDMAANSYNRYAEDIALAAELNLDVYRFSISWARLCPDGHCDKNTTQKGIDHYHKVIDEIIKYKMTPMITIYHFDHPQALEDEFGGWLDVKMVDVFIKYADLVFKEYGDKVDYWVTINEPNMHCLSAYTGGLPPGINMNTTPSMVYKCIHHEILAHSASYKLYQDKYKAKSPNGIVGIGAVTFFSRPNSTEFDDINAALRANMFDLGLLLNPLAHGDYPEVVRRTLASKGDGYLPKFTEEQKKSLPGTVDFVGLNAYFGQTVADPRKKNPETVPVPTFTLGAWKIDPNVTEVYDAVPSGVGGFGNVFAKVSPWIIREASLFIKAYFPDLKVFITENGMGDSTENSTDDWGSRAVYHSAYLRLLMRTINEDQANVIGYTVWSFLDDYEWGGGGYKRRFGIVRVDYENRTLNRTLKRSKYFFQKMMADRSVPLVEAASAAPSSTTSSSSAKATAFLTVVLASVMSLLKTSAL